MKALSDVRLVVLNLSFTNTSLVPDCIPHRQKESVKEFVNRKASVRGRQILDPVQEVSGAWFPKDLEKNGFELVDAFSRLREKDGREFINVQFVYCAKGFVQHHDDFLEMKDDLVQAAEELLEEALWRVRMFLNPFFNAGQSVDGQFAISVNFEARSPLVDGDGNKLLRWKRNEKNEKIGDAPVPIEPKRILRIERGCVVVKDV